MRMMINSMARSSTNTLAPALLACALLASLTACSGKRGAAAPDNPRLCAGVTLRDITFHSVALGRDMTYRVILPSNLNAADKLPAVYLLHGGGADFREWSNDSDVARFALQGLILVMPEGDSSYYTNAAGRPEDRYEDYIVTDLIADVERRFPVASIRGQRSIAGVSMGGFGAVKIALRHPDLFAFAGGLSPAVDVPSRPFSLRRVEQWRRFRAIFGPWEGEVQRANDPFVLARAVDPMKTPYFFLTCGEQEGLLGPNQQFSGELRARRFAFEFHTAKGGHNWNQWNSWLPSLFQSLSQHTHAAS